MKGLLDNCIIKDDLCKVAKHAPKKGIIITRTQSIRLVDSGGKSNNYKFQPAKTEHSFVLFEVIGLGQPVKRHNYGNVVYSW